jgi:hypothetical protein
MWLTARLTKQLPSLVRNGRRSILENGKSWLLLSCEQRKYMLTRWYDLGLSRDEYGLLLHLRHQHVIVMGRAIKDAKDTNKRVALLKKMSRSTIWNKDVGKSRWDDPVYTYIP